MSSADQLARVRDEAIARLAGLDDLAALKAFETEVVGPDSAVMEARRGLKDVPPEQRKDLGRAINEAKTALEAIPSVNPDLIIVDLSLKESDGIDLIQKLHRQYPQLRVLVFSMHSETALVARALQSGAHGYVTKEEGASEAITAIRSLLRGNHYLSEQAARKIARSPNEPPTSHADQRTGPKLRRPPRPGGGRTSAWLSRVCAARCFASRYAIVSVLFWRCWQALFCFAQHIGQGFLGDIGRFGIGSVRVRESNHEPADRTVDCAVRWFCQ